MITFRQFITESGDHHYSVWFVGKKGLQHVITPDYNFLHVDMMKKHKEIPKMATYQQERKIVDETPRGRADIDHQKKKIMHTDYGWGVHPEISAHLKAKYPEYKEETLTHRLRKS